MSGTSEGDIEEWLASKCFMQRDKAAQIASQLKEELWISNVNGLRLSLEENPTLLLQLNLPSHIVSTVKASLIKRLKDLSIAEVKIILRNMFPDEPDYINRFEQSKITGIVLCFNSSPSKLQEWGINSNIHAEVLQNCLEEWKKEGVPRLMLRDEDKQTSTSSINESLPDKEVKQPADCSEPVGEDSVSTIGLDAIPAAPQKLEVHETSDNSSSSSQSFSTAKNAKEGVLEKVPGRKRSASSAGLDELRRSPRHPPSTTVTPCSSAPSSPTPSLSGAENEDKASSGCDSAEHKKKKSRGRPRKVSITPRVSTRSDLISSPKQNPPELRKGVVTSPSPLQSPKRPNSDPALECSHPSVNATVDLYLEMVTSKKAAEQTKGLNALHRMITEDATSVNSMRVVGAIDALLSMLTKHSSLQEVVLIGVLDVINTIIALARDANVRHLIEKDLINMVLPLCNSNTVRVRLLALWIIGNSGTVYFKDNVIRPNVLNGLEESYNSILRFRNKDLSDVRDRFAETFKQLCSGSASTQFSPLSKLVPAMVDVISNEDRVEAVSGACEAFNHLIDANGIKAVELFNTSGVIAVLIEKLSASRIMTVYNCLRSLSFIVACSTEEQVQYVEPAVEHLERLMIPAGATGTSSISGGGGASASAASSPKVASQAALFVAMLCKGGERPLEVIMQRAPRLMPFLFDTLSPQTVVQLKQHKLNSRAQNAALALMYAAQRGNNNQLSALLALGVYTYAFRILLTFDDIPNLVIQTLKALRRIVVKVQNIHDLQVTEADFNSKRFWAKVEALTHTNKSGCTKLSDLAAAAAAASDDSGVETLHVSITDAKVRKYALRLYEIAQSQKLLST